MKRTITRTAAVTIALGAGSMTLATGAPTAAQAAPTQSHPVVRTSPSASRPATTLRYGMRGTAVRNLQAALTDAGFSVPQTGYYGHLTRDAVQKFQASKGLHASGVATPATLRQLGVTKSTAASAQRLTSSTYSASDSTVSTASDSTVSTASNSTVSTATVNAASSAAQTAVNFAYSKIGTPYVYGGTGNGGYDCSGLTQAAWAAAGVSIPRTSYAQWSGLTKVSTSNLQPGDLVIFYGGGHVGIYVGNGYVIHAPRPGKTVEKVLMSSMPVAGAVRPA